MGRHILPTILATALVLFVLLAAMGVLFIYSGVYNVAATGGHIGLVRWVLATTTEESIQAHADEVEISLPADSSALRRGYQAYSDMCVVCHGAPGLERGWIGKGVLPEPPEMRRVAEEWEPNEIHWVLRHGIKFAGMPALAPTHSEEQILELTAFVEAMETMTPEEYQAWGQAEGAEQEAAGHTHEHGGHSH